MKNTRLKTLLLVIIVIIIACSKDEDGVAKEKYDFTAYSEVLRDDYLSASLNNCVELSKALQSGFKPFKEKQNDQNLLALQNTWKEFTIEWQQLKFFNLNAVSEAEIIPLYFQVDAWPVNTTFIENIIRANDDLNSTFIQTKGVTSKGFHGLEYMLFNEIGNEPVLDSYNTDSTGRRPAYVEAVINNINEAVERIDSIWTDNPNSYQYTFVNTTVESIPEFYNLLINELEVLEKLRLGIPLGKSNDGTILPYELESYRSKQSYEHIKSTLDAFETLFIANELTGFDDVLNYYGANKLLVEVQGLIDDIQQLAADGPAPLFEEIETSVNHYDELHGKINDLIFLLKTDVANSLDITISFSDNDGD